MMMMELDEIIASVPSREGGGWRERGRGEGRRGRENGVRGRRKRGYGLTLPPRYKTLVGLRPDG